MQNRLLTSSMIVRVKETDVWASDLLQVLTIIGMERPISFSAEDIRDEKV